MPPGARRLCAGSLRLSGSLLTYAELTSSGHRPSGDTAQKGTLLLGTEPAGGPGPPHCAPAPNGRRSQQAVPESPPLVDTLSPPASRRSPSHAGFAAHGD